MHGSYRSGVSVIHNNGIHLEMDVFNWCSFPPTMFRILSYLHQCLSFTCNLFLLNIYIVFFLMCLSVFCLMCSYNTHLYIMVTYVWPI
jgi:hypothetical protein